jgi:hypothetical protein
MQRAKNLQGFVKQPAAARPPARLDKTLPVGEGAGRQRGERGWLWRAQPARIAVTFTLASIGRSPAVHAVASRVLGRPTRTESGFMSGVRWSACDPAILESRAGRLRTYDSASGAIMFDARSTNSQTGTPAAGLSSSGKYLPHRRQQEECGYWKKKQHQSNSDLSRTNDHRQAG